MKLLKPGRPELKDAYSPEKAKLPTVSWWAGSQFDCPCGAEFELESGDEMQGLPGTFAIRCPHCQMVHYLSYARICPVI